MSTVSTLTGTLQAVTLTGTLTSVTGTADPDATLQSEWDDATSGVKNTFVDLNQTVIITHMDDPIQDTWDAGTSGEKNTFVDANDTEILTHVNWDWAKLVAALGRGYNFPAPTGQTTSYRTGDDANIEATVFGATVRNTESLKARNTLASFLVLNNNNVNGNTNRFTAPDGTQTYTDDLVVDHYTGMMIFRQIVAVNTSWNLAIDAALASSEGSHEDWFIPNMNQARSIFSSEADGSGNQHFFRYAPFNASTSGNSLIYSSSSILMISTTYPDNTSNVFMTSGAAGVMSWSTAKTNTNMESWMMRKHF